MNLIEDKAEEISSIVWRVDGKVKEINRPSTSTKKKLTFDYENLPWQMKGERFSGKKNSAEEMGNRIAKHVFDNQTGLLERSTYYILDAQGNQLTTYEHVVDNATANFVLKERHIFGSSRLGMLNEDVNVLTAQIGQNVQHEVGKKYYELSNHLGNVLSVFTDLKIPQSSNTVTVSSYRVFIAGTTDYSPFGVELDGRTQSPEAYRYSFNGMEHDNEIKGEGNTYDYGARMLDARIGRWLSIDPKTEKYPMDSPFMSFGANPICIIDPDGKEKIIVVGSENRKWKLGFILPAMKYAKDLKKSSGDEKVTILLFKAGYSDKQMSKIQKYVNKKVVAIQVVSTSDEVVNYFNNKSITSSQSGRKEDPISFVSIFAHGYVGNIAFGYHQGGKTETNSNFGEDQVKKINASSFKNGAILESWACRTGAGVDVEADTYKGDGWDTDAEKSLAQTMANHWGITVFAGQRRTEYGNILPEKTVTQRFLEWQYGDNTYSNEGNWDNDVAVDQVSQPTFSGTTPKNSPGLTKYEKAKTPTIVGNVP